jgi:hypothetical protein
MIHAVDPRQNRPFDPSDGLLPPAGRKILGNGWPGVFRHGLLEVMPVVELAQHFSDSLGAPTKGLDSRAALVFLADSFGWTTQEAADASLFRSDVPYAWNLEPGVTVSARTIERSQGLFRDDDRAAGLFEDMTDRLVRAWDLDVSRQRLDSTHVFSHRASCGRTKLLAVAIKRFLTPSKRHDSDAFAALPEGLRRRSAPAPARRRADAKDAEARARGRQRAAEDLHFLIRRVADRTDHTNRSSSQALITIFGQQCERSGDQVVVRAKTGGDCVPNPSDLEATSSGHQGSGYRVQRAETRAPGNEVQRITAALPPSACEPDAGAVVPMLDRLKQGERLPDELLADPISCGDEDVQAAAALGVDLVGPIPGRAPAADPEALTVDDFAWNEHTRTIDACPAGHRPTSCAQDAETATTRLEMPASACAECPFRERCPIEDTRDGKFTLEFTAKQRRLAGRRVEEAPAVFKERDAPRAGLASANSGLKNRPGLGRLPVRGRGSVFRVILHKVAGGNVPRAAASQKLRAWVRTQVAETLRGGESGPTERPYASALRVRSGFPMVLGASHGCSHGLVVLRAA